MTQMLRISGSGKQAPMETAALGNVPGLVPNAVTQGTPLPRGDSDRIGGRWTQESAFLHFYSSHRLVISKEGFASGRLVSGS